MKNFKKLVASASTVAGMAAMTLTQAFAQDMGAIDGVGNVDGGTAMTGIVNTLIAIARFVGVALAAYGVYEVVQSFMQNQPEAKTKGVVMVACGAAMIGLGPLIHGVVGV